jgi:dienelactone hydrolase
MRQPRRRFALALASLLVVACLAGAEGPINDPESPYLTQGYLRARFDAVGQSLRYDGKSDAAAWQEDARKTLSKLIGLDTMQTCSLEPRVTDRVDCGDYTRERVELQVEPGLVMPVYVLVPKGEGPFPTVLAPHGHGGGGKAAVAGIRNEKKIAASIEKNHYDYGVSFVKAGFIALCPDARGFGERREIRSQRDVLASSCRSINNMAMPLGQTVTGMWVWDLKRLIDYAESRPDCDTERLACAGLSGGGLQTLWVTALDTRIKAAVVSGYFYGVKQSLLDMHANCSCNYVPHLWEHADHGDLGALIAPRPLMIQTGDVDSLNGAGGLDNVYPQVAIAKRLYTTLDAESNLKHDIFEGPHRWDNTNSIPFIEQALATDD